MSLRFKLDVLLEAIKSKNVNRIHALANNCTNDVKKELLNPVFEPPKCRTKYRHSRDSLFQDPPLLFYAVFQGRETYETLLQNGASLMLTDQHGFNVCHFLCVVGFVIPAMESECVSIYNRLIVQVGHKRMNTLLRMEDFEGLRPLELAVHLGCIKLFYAIFNTPGIYLLKSHRQGFYCIKEYDVTEYESIGGSSRRNKSPMMFLTTVDSRILKNCDAMHSLCAGPIAAWANHKIKYNVPFIFLWSLLRLLCIFCFYLLVGYDANISFYDIINNRTNNDVVNTTEPLCESVTDWFGLYTDENILIFSLIYVWVFSLISLFSEIVEGFVTLTLESRKWKKCFGKPKDTLVSTVHYRLCQCIFCFIGNLLITTYTLSPARNLEPALIGITYVSTWSILYFAQLLPHIGYFVNTIQRMLSVMLQFVIVYLIIVLPFTCAFQIILRSDLCEMVEGFESLPAAAYSVFKIMLNMIDLTERYSESSHTLLLLHVTFVFMVAILLINFLVALFSNSIYEILEAKEVIMLVQRLSVVTLIEWRLIYPFAFIYRYLHKRVYKCSKGKIIIKHSELIKHV